MNKKIIFHHILFSSNVVVHHIFSMKEKHVLTLIKFDWFQFLEDFERKTACVEQFEHTKIHEIQEPEIIIYF